MKSPIPNIQQIKCYVINLDRSKDRLEYITQIFNKCGLEFERIAAVDGTLLSKEELNKLTEKSTWQPKLTSSEVGCFLSHRECLRRTAEGSESWVAIFEDDVMLSPNITFLFQDTNWIPNDTDIVKLETHKMFCTLGRKKEIVVAGKITTPYYLAPLLSKHYGAGGYIISRQCAKKLLNLTQNITAPIDVIYFEINHELPDKLKVQQIIPAPVIQLGITSTVEKRIKIKENISFYRKLVRETVRVYHRNLKANWQTLTRGYYTGRVPFK